MQNKIELILNTPANSYLDLGNFDISLNYRFNDIRDIAKRNGSYSKTIILPSTKNNNLILGGLYDINSDFTLFNPNKKTDAKLLVNSETVIDGFIHLVNIRKLSNVDLQGNSVFYEMVIYANSIDLLTELGDKYLSDIPSLDEWNHLYTEKNIENSWVNTEGYVYPMIGTQDVDNNYESKHFYPAFFYHTMLDSIISDAGYGWRGTLKTNPQFINEILPYTGNGTPKISEAGVLRKEFNVGVVEETPIIFTEANDSSTNDPFFWKVGGAEEVVVPFTIVNNDPTNQYDNVNQIWRAEVGGDYTLDLDLNYKIEWTNTTALDLTVIATTGYVYDVIHTIQKLVSGVWTAVDTITMSQVVGPALIPASGSTSTQIQVQQSSQILSLDVYDELRVVLSIYKRRGFYSNLAVIPQVDTTVYYIGTVNTLSNTSLNQSVGINDEVIIANFVPRLKQSDLIKDLIKRYNLVIYQDPDNPKIVVLDSYNDYYLENTEILDWSGKKDYSKEDNIKLLSELQYKTASFSYTPDTTAGDVNVDYTGVTKETYGELEFTFDNDFVKGTEEIMSPFSPTPTIKTVFGAYLPSINRDNPKGRPRVLYYGGLRTLDGFNNWNFNGAYKTVYPYAGHFDHPKTPNLDLNFDWCRFYFHNDVEVLTSNNQFNTYWSSYFKQIQTGKLLTAYFKLDETDIRKVKNRLSYKIWVKDAYYYINSIIDYNPLSNGVTKVELIKATELGYYISEGVYDIGGGASCPTDLYVRSYGNEPNITRYYRSYSGQTIDAACCASLGGIYNATNMSCELPASFNTGLNNVSPPPSALSGRVAMPSGGAVVLGANNITGGLQVLTVEDEDENEGQSVSVNKQLVVGDNNNVLHNTVMVVGNRNTIASADSSILNGSDNTIKSSLTTVIGAVEQTIDDPNRVYLGNEFKVDTVTGEYYIGGKLVDRVYTETVSVPSAEILELFTTPKLLIPAPEANQYIMMVAASMYLDFNTSIYSGDNDFEIYVENAEELYFIGEKFPNADTTGVYDFIKYVPMPPATQSKLGEAVHLGVKHTISGGDSDVVITIEYRIITVD